MARRKKEIDKIFLMLVIALIIWGLIIFIFASLGLLAREGASFSSVFYKHFISIFLGSILLLICAHVPYSFWKRKSFYIFIGSLFFSLLVFIPELAMYHSGVNRWIDLGVISIQPAEFLKLGYVIYLSAWLSGFKAEKLKNPYYSILPFLIITAISAGILLMQPDFGTLLVISIAGLFILFSAGTKIRWIGALLGAGGVFVLSIYYLVPYIGERINTFLNPTIDTTGAGYQIKQSLLAIGSGGLFGRGAGQSIQKFTFLPEPISDSIFAVAAEEFGFIGSFILITLFILIALRGIRIASRAKDYFGSLLVIGIIALIVGQSFINMASMMSIFPITGMPLLFVSHGGSAFLASLAGIGIILNISKDANI